MPLVVFITDFFCSRGLENLYFIILDLIAAFYLTIIARRKFGKESIIPVIVSASYLFGEGKISLFTFRYLLNPLGLMSSGAKSSSVLTHITLLGALYHGMCGDQLVSLLYASFGTYISLYSISIFAPVSTFSSSSPRSFKSNVIIFGAMLSSLILISWNMTGTWRFLLSSHYSRLTFESLRPNVGLYWYLFTEVFDFFRPLFISFLQLHIFFYGFPAAVRFNDDPLFMGFVVIGLQCLLQPYPTVADAGLYLSMIPLFPEIVKNLKMLYPGLLTLLFTMVLAPVNWYYWVHHGSGNANFYYATTLVYNIAHVCIIVEVIRTHILNDVLSRNPTLKATDIYQK